MSAVGAVVVCILSGLGLASLIWAVVGAFLLPISTGGDIRLHMVIETKGDGSRLQSVVDSIRWLMDLGLAEFDIVILDGGMDVEASRQASLLARMDNVSLCRLVCFDSEPTENDE